MDPSLLEPHERLIRIVILGRVFEVPENNLLLRQMQYLADDIGYGRYCWNAECRYCEITYSKDGGPDLQALACRIKGQEGMTVSKVAPEIKYNMADALAAAPRQEG
jgi:hypothetical protein